MKKNLFSIAFLFCFFTSLLLVHFAVAQENPVPEIVITEVAAFEPPETEWIEIYNRSGAPVDLTGWKFLEDQTHHGLNAFRGDAILDPQEIAVIANKADQFATKYPTYAGTIFDSSWSSLKEEGEEIGLKDGKGDLAELFVYPAAGATSLERKDVNMAAQDITNWSVHPTAHSLGQLWQMPAPDVAGTTTPVAELPEVPAISNEEPPENSESAPIPAEPQFPPSAPTQPLISHTPNMPPQAVIQIQKGSLIAQGKTTIHFDGRGSWDPNGDSLNFIWDFGDGSMEEGPNPRTHTYSTPGTYHVSLIAMDTFGAQGKASVDVQVLALPEKNKKVATAGPSSIAPRTQPLQNTSLAGSTLPLLALPESALELRGYFIFVPTGNFASEKISSPTKSKKSLQASAKKPYAKKLPAPSMYQDGDLSDFIRITEIFPAPEKGGQEWIEIANLGDTPVNLGNWLLTTEKKKTGGYHIPNSVDLSPGEYRIFFAKEIKLPLNNEGTRVSLFDYQGAEISHVAYDHAKPAHAYANIQVDASAPKWGWTASPTPGKQNPTLKKITGIVGAFLAGQENQAASMEIDLSNGSAKRVKINQEELQPFFDGKLIGEGAVIDMTGEEAKDGSFRLANIEALHPSSQQEEERAWWSPRTMTGLLAVSLLFNIPLAFGALRKKEKKREFYTAPPEKKADFQTDGIG